MSHVTTPFVPPRAVGDEYGSVAPSAEDMAGRLLAENDDGDREEDDEMQAGVRNMEATTLVWTRPALVAAYAMVWIVCLVDSTQQGAATALGPWVTSAFGQHSLTPTVNIMSQIVGGVFKLTLARVLDVFGRPQGFLLSILLTTLGYALMAVCRGLASYAAAHVFCSVGFNGLGYCLTVFVADASSLRNRGLVMAYSSSPFIITAWLAGPLSEAFLRGPGFRWAFAVFAVVTPAVTLPLYGLFMHHHRKAERLGLGGHKATTTAGSHRPFSLRALVHYGREFDVIGLLLLSAGLALLLLPLNIFSYQELGWRSPLILGLLSAGACLVVLFAAWERYGASVNFIPYALLVDRTLLGACVLASATFVSFFIWDAYFPSFLQVVNGLSVTQASYVAQIYNIGSCLWSLVVGLVIRRTGRFKRLALYLGVPLSALGVGLMIKSRQPDANIGFLVLCQILIAVAGGTMVICEQTAVMAAAPRQYVAVVLAIEAMFAAIGGAVGLSVSASIWQAVFPRKLRQYLPSSELDKLDSIYGRLDVQLSYPVGSPARTAIQRAYGDGQKAMLITSTSVLVVAFVATAAWRDIDVRKIKPVSVSVA
ncbi:major facilitator superfamily protein [Hirsutella rhossiliensis]|uniref:Major facilitator superfamily domain-containing protein n=1 Tax=Hirsutella rhossiliensis TaxID=111463 RepID=A0A9P8N960_9HYPO|nr:major facilitator superfamily domain-containing protein [Hirsutella rhossiliensis]KAH0968291.1 major facilitator superfamily domain-containing protein [Hirsutella rhossiliensis]